MGLVFNKKSINNNYIKRLKCGTGISHRRAAKSLTRRNIQFLKSLGLRVVAPGGK